MKGATSTAEDGNAGTGGTSGATVGKREQEQAKQAAKRVERVAHAKAHEQSNRAELDRLTAELDRLTAPVVPDRAATGGAVHPSIAKRINAQFSDSRVQKVGRLMGRQKELEAQITLAQS